MAQEEIALMAHLLRRAGFGATREELERDVDRGAVSRGVQGLGDDFLVRP